MSPKMGRKTTTKAKVLLATGVVAAALGWAVRGREQTKPAQSTAPEVRERLVPSPQPEANPSQHQTAGASSSKDAKPAWSADSIAARWAVLNAKSLLTDAETREAEALQSNPELRRKAIARLNRQGSMDWDLDEEVDRMRAVDFVRSLIDSPSEELRQAGVAAALEVLASPLGESPVPYDFHLLSRLGDRIELMNSIFVHAPKSTDQMIDQITDRRTLNALEWILKSQLSLAKKEG